MKVLNWFLSMLFLMALIMVVFSAGPLVETAYFPVYSKFKIINVERELTGLRLQLQFTKYRNCDPQGYAWYVGDLGIGLRQLPISVTPYGTVHRPLGTQFTQPMLVQDLRVEDLPNLKAEIYSRCHPLWITRSVIYP
jgi:hypothetical protein